MYPVSQQDNAPRPNEADAARVELYKFETTLRTVIMAYSVAGRLILITNLLSKEAAPAWFKPAIQNILDLIRAEIIELRTENGELRIEIINLRTEINGLRIHMTRVRIRVAQVQLRYH